MIKNLPTGVILLSLLLIGIFSCQTLEFEDPENLEINYSLDTLTFDTVFTQVGSTTRYFKIYNRGDKFARLQEVKLNNPESKFRINVDGRQGPSVSDVEIPPHDSIYVFVEVTVDPDQPISASPFIIEEHLSILRGNSDDQVTLTAWGQNANYIPSLQSKDRQALITCDFGKWTWDDPKPYVIYGVLVIDSCDLEIPAGTRVYVHGGLVQNNETSYQDGVLFIGKNASIRTLGTAENPVTFQTDRLEEEYQERLGQWGRIHLAPESKNNSFSYTHILHSQFGVYVDSLAELELDHSIVGFNSYFGIYGFRANVKAENCLFHTSGGYNLRTALGGQYDFKHCTFANIGYGQEAVLLSNFYCYDQNPQPGSCENGLVSRLNAHFENSILYSSKSDALILNNAILDEPSYFQVEFEHSIIRARDLTEDGAYPDFFEDYPTTIQYHFGDALFKDENEYNFALDSLSIAKNQADLIPEITDDILGNSRGTTPDIGAYEFID
ncbi:hypothetical protein [Membranihabitans maritimus]|uniref:hypothetical protein n=1 Tax=Membranihabitans maritimus TaxID=2904244 RepID=UPI001F448861|nr:hypothetical protein [Membranihabitans maritimus]